MRGAVASRFPSCILATCVVPWSEQGRFLDEPFRRQVRALATQLTRHLYIFGTAGEGYAVGERQFDEIVAVFDAECRRLAIEPMVGIISLSTVAVVERIERCRERGIRDFQISLPAWHALNDAELAAFFRETCGRFTDCRFLHYNLGRTKRLLTPDEYVRLADEHPNLTATKNTSYVGDDLQSLLHKTPSVTHFVGERGFAQAGGNANCGLLTSISSLSWRGCREFFADCRAGDVAATARRSLDIAGLTEALLHTLGTPHIDGAYDKLLWAVHDREFPLRLLPPYVGADATMIDALRHDIAERFSEWLPETL